MSTAPFLMTDTLMGQMRGYQAPKALSELHFSYYFLHELGHLFLHRGHPWDHPGCEMKPAVGLDFNSWVQEVSAAPPCAKTHKLITTF
jgi:hypothetical protein